MCNSLIQHERWNENAASNTESKAVSYQEALALEIMFTVWT